ncbi:MAG: pantetheine-phosphate adenylyltransferase [Pyrinomonadaceae bacterium]
MQRALFPGSFDPLTSGHLDVIRRAAPLFDELIIGVVNNADKVSMFSLDERCDLIREVLASESTAGAAVVVESFSGLTAVFARQSGARAIVRGIRAVSDYEYELRMARMNRRLEPSIETAFLLAGEEFSFVSSTLLKQVFELGGPIDGLVHPIVEARMREKQLGHQRVPSA